MTMAQIDALLEVHERIEGEAKDHGSSDDLHKLAVAAKRA